MFAKLTDPKVSIILPSYGKQRNRLQGIFKIYQFYIVKLYVESIQKMRNALFTYQIFFLS